MDGLQGKGGWEGNITIEARRYADRPGGQLVFRGEARCGGGTTCGGGADERENGQIPGSA